MINLNDIKNMAIEDKKQLYMSIIKEHNLNIHLLEYDLEHLYHYYKSNNIKYNDFTELLAVMKIIFEKYDLLYKKSVLEDEQWNLHIKSSIKYDLYDDEAIFDNSVESIYKYDTYTDALITKLLNIFSILSDNYIVDIKSIEDKVEDIYWVLFIVKKKIEK